METQQTGPFHRLDGRQRAGFLEERNIFLQNVERVRRTQADMAALMQQVKTQWEEITAAQMETQALREAIEKQWQASVQTVIGRR